jgi:hypothetical protein
MLEAEGKPKSKRGYWYALIRDAQDGELRVIYRSRLQAYHGVPGVKWEFGTYNGAWSLVMESKDQDYLRSFGRLTAPETWWNGYGKYRFDSYFSYLEGRESAEKD